MLRLVVFGSGVFDWLNRWKLVGGNWQLGWKFVGGNWWVAVGWWHLVGGKVVGGNWLVAVGG